MMKMKYFRLTNQLTLALLIPLLLAGVLVLPALRAQAGVVLTTLHSFQASPDGAGPGPLVQGSDGYFYGTSYQGGAHKDHYGAGQGTVFKISVDGALTSLYSFGSVQDTLGVPLDGANPVGGLVQGGDGYFYGTTQLGGTNNYGTVFKISPNGALTSLYSFTRHDGLYPSAGLVQGSDGSFYGTTEGGGTNDDGTVFKINANGALTSLYSFTGGDDGSTPLTGLVRGNDGNFYGTTTGTTGEGRNGAGTVFKISPNGALTIIFSFLNVSGILRVQASDGYFYGTFGANGHTNTPCCSISTGLGAVFKISTEGTLTTLHSFGSDTNANGVPLDGGGPNGLVQGRDGSFYGTTTQGGTNGFGTVFQISSNGTLTTLYAFGTVTNADGQPLDGAMPISLVQAKDGNLYGTTGDGGSGGGGTFFQLVMPRFRGVARQAGGSMSLSGTGPANGAYRLWASPDLSMPFASWTLLTSSSFDRTGNFSFTDASAPTNKSRFYQLSVP